MTAIVVSPHIPEGPVIERATIEELARAYEEAEAKIVAAFGVVADSLRLIHRALYDDGSSPRGQGITCITVNRFRRESVDFGETDFAIEELRRDAWRTLINRSRVRMAMSVAAWNELSSKIEHGTPLPITVENVMGVIDALRADVPKMLEDAVREVFGALRPPGSRYKTNTEFELSERVVLAHWIEAANKYTFRWTPNHYRVQDFITLNNVFNLLDGKLLDGDGPYYGELGTAISKTPADVQCHGETEYFEYRGYRNGNLHLRFKRLDLVKKLNTIAGGLTLKPEGAE